MPLHGPTPILLCLFSMWRILTPVSSHPQHIPCQLIQRTALCNDAKLALVPAGLPDNIEELQLNFNHIQTLQYNSLSFPSLKTLSLACNNLVKLESNTFQHTKLLESLNLANNILNSDYQETSLSLRTLPRLRVLDLSENTLDEEMVATLVQNLTSLEYLNLSGNIMKRLDETSFRDLHQLKELDLQRNIMFEIDAAFDNNPNLQRLNLAFNCLPCLIDFHMTQLVVLNVSHNLIEWFISRQDLNDTFSLETLDLSDNKLLFFPFLPGRSHLRHLYLSHNSVKFYQHLSDNDNATETNSTSTVEFYNMKNMNNVTAKLWDEDLHGDISSVEILDLSRNQVEYFPQGFLQKMPALSRLHMFTNCLETFNLTSERLSDSLYELDVSNNRLNQIVASEEVMTALCNLTYLNLSLNNLQQLPSGFFSSLPNVRSVDLSYNSIDICFPEDTKTSEDGMSSCMDWYNMTSLRQLYLKGCNLNIIPSSAFAGLSLTHLELSDNPGLIVQESVYSLSRTLQHLGLGNTHIQDFDFSHFQSLKSLNISQNFLVEIPPSLLNLHLKVLDLRDNRLSTIPSGQANALAPKLQTVFLAGNPFNCCQTEWYRTFEATKTMQLPGKSEIECEDLFLTTHRVVDDKAFLCWEEGGESVFWYILLFVPMCLLFMGVSIVVILPFKSKMLQKSIKKRCMKPTSY